jgi:inward rectifier potassium channel
MIDSVTERKESDLDDRFRVNVRFGSALIILLLGAAGSSMTAMVFLGLLLTVCVAQVIFDIFSSPMVHDHLERDSISLKDNLHRRRSEEHTATDERRFSPDEAVRKGTPSQFRRDLYAFFMDGTWKQLFVVLGITFFLTNVVFASLYMIRPGCIDGVGPRGFWDAFYFSVQTISTIGYGTLSPITDYGNVIVTFEAATGLLLTALATGLMFAKASRPRANVMFTDHLLFTTHDGEPALLFRAANARGHEVVDASMNVTVLMDHLTAEGQHLRRMNELKLVRDRSPYFALSWTVIHIVDEDSPLHGMTSDEIMDNVSTITCTLIGYDSTYAQTVHARQPYISSDFVFDHQFADILSTLPDGRLMIDYEKFDDLEAVDPSAENSLLFDDLVTDRAHDGPDGQ